MNQAEMRSIAMGAARSRLRMMNIDPVTSDADAALRALDDNYRVDPEMLASLWYDNASDNQIKLFRKEWEKWTQSMS